MKNVLFISYDGMTDTLGQSQVLPYLVGLQKEGFTIHILSTEKPDNFKKEKNVIQNICDTNDISWHYVGYTKKPPVISTLKDVRKLQKKAKEICLNHNIDILHCRSYLSALIGQKLKKELNIKFLFDMRGFWADERVDGKIWNIKNPIFKTIYNYFKKKEKQFVVEADAIVSLTENGKEEIESWGLNNAPITVIPCCADFEHFNYNNVSQTEIDETKLDLGVTRDDFIITYLGSIGTWYMLNEMLDFFKQLKSTYPNSKFQFITKEPKEPIINEATKRGIDATDLIIAPATRNEVPARVAISDLSIFFIKPLYSKKASSPTKQAEIMGMGIPLICNTNVGDVDRIVAQTKSGVQVNDFTIEGYKQSIQQIPNLFNISKEHIRSQGVKYFDLNDAISEYKGIYQTIINN